MDDNHNLQKAKELLQKYDEGSCTDEEKAWVENWYLRLNTHQTDLLDTEIIAQLAKLDSKVKKIPNGEAPATKTIPLWTKLIAVAAFLLVIGTLFYVNRRNLIDTSLPAPHLADIRPGGNKAILTLAGGQKIILSKVSNGTLANESGTEISKTSDGQIIYKQGSNTPGNASNAYNTIETPNGGQYQVRLPDGSEVWLNAASKLIYPVSLTGRGRREVTLIGEAYFQVAKDKAHPFIVKSAGQQVEVLGTHFNVNSYSDEGRVVTTLEEGSVQVTAGTKDRVIKPGQQTLVSSNYLIEVQQANMQTAFAWKNNKLSFEDAHIGEIMRQVARWYDLQIEYRGAIPTDTFTGTINRQSNLSTVLEMFKSSAINFSLEQTPAGKKLIIKP